MISQFAACDCPLCDHPEMWTDDAPDQNAFALCRDVIGEASSDRTTRELLDTSVRWE